MRASAGRFLLGNWAEMSGMRRQLGQIGIQRASISLVSGNRGKLLRFFKHGFGADDYHNTVFADRIARAVGFGVITDHGALGNADVPIYDGAPNPRAASDVHMIENDRVFHFTIAVDPNVVAQDAALDAAS